MNKYKPNLLILCEDAINRDIAKGFILGLHDLHGFLNPSPIETHHELAAGWCKAIDNLENSWINKLQDNPNLFLLVLIDSDGRMDRIQEIKSKLPNDLINRISVMGCFHQPETLKKQAHTAIKQMDKKAKVSDENVGKALFQHCKDNPENNLWHSDELKHNLAEIEQLKENTKHFIDWYF